MALDPKKRQQKLMKQRQKDAARKKALARAPVPYSERPVTAKIRGARKHPILDCVINAEWKESGMASIMISRRQPDGFVCFGVFLVDIWCLGLKSCFFNADYGQFEYEDRVLDRVITGTPTDCPVDLAHRIIYGAIEYAGKLGFKPDRDFELGQYILDPPEAHADGPAVEFGKNGKPVFVAGPDDDAVDILLKLDAAVGAGNYEFVLGGGLGELEELVDLEDLEELEEMQREEPVDLGEAEMDDGVEGGKPKP